jgi:hypothetical protein
VPADAGTQARVKRDLGSVKRDLESVKRDLGSVKRDLGSVKRDLGSVKRDLGSVKRDLPAGMQAHRRSNMHCIGSCQFFLLVLFFEDACHRALPQSRHVISIFIFYFIFIFKMHSIWSHHLLLIRTEQSVAY